MLNELNTSYIRICDNLSLLLYRSLLKDNIIQFNDEWLNSQCIYDIIRVINEHTLRNASSDDKSVLILLKHDRLVEQTVSLHKRNCYLCKKSYEARNLQGTFLDNKIYCIICICVMIILTYHVVDEEKLPDSLLSNFNHHCRVILSYINSNYPDLINDPNSNDIGKAYQCNTDSYANTPTHKENNIRVNRSQRNNRKYKVDFLSGDYKSKEAKKEPTNNRSLENFKLTEKKNAACSNLRLENKTIEVKGDFDPIHNLKRVYIASEDFNSSQLLTDQLDTLTGNGKDNDNGSLLNTTTCEHPVDQDVDDQASLSSLLDVIYSEYTELFNGKNLTKVYNRITRVALLILAKLLFSNNRTPILQSFLLNLCHSNNYSVSDCFSNFVNDYECQNDDYTNTYIGNLRDYTDDILDLSIVFDSLKRLVPLAIVSRECYCFVKFCVSNSCQLSVNTVSHVYTVDTPVLHQKLHSKRLNCRQIIYQLTSAQLTYNVVNFLRGLEFCYKLLYDLNTVTSPGIIITSKSDHKRALPHSEILQLHKVTSMKADVTVTLPLGFCLLKLQHLYMTLLRIKNAHSINCKELLSYQCSNNSCNSMADQESSNVGFGKSTVLDNFSVPSYLNSIIHEFGLLETFCLAYTIQTSILYDIPKHMANNNDHAIGSSTILSKQYNHSTDHTNILQYLSFTPCNNSKITNQTNTEQYGTTALKNNDKPENIDCNNSANNTKTIISSKIGNVDNNGKTISNIYESVLLYMDNVTNELPLSDISRTGIESDYNKMTTANNNIHQMITNQEESACGMDCDYSEHILRFQRAVELFKLDQGHIYDFCNELLTGSMFNNRHSIDNVDAAFSLLNDYSSRNNITTGNVVDALIGNKLITLLTSDHVTEPADRGIVCTQADSPLSEICEVASTKKSGRLSMACFSLSASASNIESTYKDNCQRNLASNNVTSEAYANCTNAKVSSSIVTFRSVTEALLSIYFLDRAITIYNSNHIVKQTSDNIALADIFKLPFKELKQLLQLLLKKACHKDLINSIYNSQHQNLYVRIQTFMSLHSSTNDSSVKSLIENSLTIHSIVAFCCKNIVSLDTLHVFTLFIMCLDHVADTITYDNFLPLYATALWLLFFARLTTQTAINTFDEYLTNTNRNDRTTNIHYNSVLYLLLKSFRLLIDKNCRKYHVDNGQTIHKTEYSYIAQHIVRIVTRLLSKVKIDQSSQRLFVNLINCGNFNPTQLQVNTYLVKYIREFSSLQLLMARNSACLFGLIVLMIIQGQHEIIMNNTVCSTIYSFLWYTLNQECLSGTRKITTVQLNKLVSSFCLLMCIIVNKRPINMLPDETVEELITINHQHITKNTTNIVIALLNCNTNNTDKYKWWESNIASYYNEFFNKLKDGAPNIVTTYILSRAIILADDPTSCLNGRNKQWLKNIRQNDNWFNKSWILIRLLPNNSLGKMYSMIKNLLQFAEVLLYDHFDLPLQDQKFLRWLVPMHLPIVKLLLPRVFILACLDHDLMKQTVHTVNELINQQNNNSNITSSTFLMSGFVTLRNIVIESFCYFLHFYSCFQSSSLPPAFESLKSAKIINTLKLSANEYAVDMLSKLDIPSILQVCSPEQYKTITEIYCLYDNVFNDLAQCQNTSNHDNIIDYYNFANDVNLTFEQISNILIPTMNSNRALSDELFCNMFQILNDVITPNCNNFDKQIQLIKKSTYFPNVHSTLNKQLNNNLFSVWEKCKTQIIPIHQLYCTAESLFKQSITDFNTFFNSTNYNDRIVVTNDAVNTHITLNDVLTELKSSLLCNTSNLFNDSLTKTYYQMKNYLNTCPNVDSLHYNFLCYLYSELNSFLQSNSNNLKYKHSKNDYDIMNEPIPQSNISLKQLFKSIIESTLTILKRFSRYNKDCLLKLIAVLEIFDYKQTKLKKTETANGNFSTVKDLLKRTFEPKTFINDFFSIYSTYLSSVSMSKWYSITYSLTSRCTGTYLSQALYVPLITTLTIYYPEEIAWNICGLNFRKNENVRQALQDIISTVLGICNSVLADNFTEARTALYKNIKENDVFANELYTTKVEPLIMMPSFKNHCKVIIELYSTILVLFQNLIKFTEQLNFNPKTQYTLEVACPSLYSLDLKDKHILLPISDVLEFNNNEQILSFLDIADFFDYKPAAVLEHFTQQGELSCPGFHRQKEQLFKSSSVYILSLTNALTIYPSKQRPKIIQFLTNDGFLQSFLLKNELRGDVRKDSFTVDFLRLVNSLIADSSLMKTNLQSFGSNSTLNYCAINYTVISLREHSALIQWVPASTTLKSLVNNDFMKYIPELTTTPVKPAQHLLKLNKFLALQKLNPPSLHLSYIKLFAYNPSTLAQAKINASLSIGFWSITGFILGLGDRHLENILVNTNTGELFHVDFDCLFDKGLSLPIPEIVPFRFTQNLEVLTRENSMLLINCMEQMMQRIYKPNASLFTTYIQCILNDPLLDFKNSNSSNESLRAFSLKLAGYLNYKSLYSELKNVINDSTLIELLKTFNVSPQWTANPLPTDKFVNLLMASAQDELNLALMYAGWVSIV